MKLAGAGKRCLEADFKPLELEPRSPREDAGTIEPLVFDGAISEGVNHCIKSQRVVMS